MTEIWVAFTSWLLWIVLLWTWACKYLWDPDFNVLGIYPEVGLLDYMVILFLIFWRTSILFPVAFAPFCISTDSTWRFQSLYILAVISWCLDSSHLNGCDAVPNLFTESGRCCCWSLVISYSPEVMVSNSWTLIIFSYDSFSWVSHFQKSHL